MMPDCASSKELIDRFIEGKLTSPEVQSLKVHLLSCTACRGKAMEQDPLVIFSLLTLQEKERSFWRGYWNRIAGEISASKIWRLRLPFLQPSPVPAALAALLVITIMSIVAILNVGHVPKTVQKLPARVEYGLTEQASLPAVAPIVDTTVQPTAKVVTLSVGDADVVMIFDENMDI